MVPEWTADAAWPSAALAAVAVWIRERRNSRRDRLESQQQLIDSLLQRVATLEGRVDEQSKLVTETLVAKAELAGQLDTARAALGLVTEERDRLLKQLARDSAT